MNIQDIEAKIRETREDMAYNMDFNFPLEQLQTRLKTLEELKNEMKGGK